MLARKLVFALAPIAGMETDFALAGIDVSGARIVPLADSHEIPALRVWSEISLATSIIVPTVVLLVSAFLLMGAGWLSAKAGTLTKRVVAATVIASVLLKTEFIISRSHKF